MSASYQEPLVSYLVLDFMKSEATRLCLESIKRHTLFPHKVIYLHNGDDQGGNPIEFYRDGLIDTFIQTRQNHGLGIGTRDLFAICQSEYAIYLQNDQIIGRDFTQAELNQIAGALHRSDSDGRCVKSVGLAGAPCGDRVYSERAHLIETSFYKYVEGDLPSGGAGPYHDHPWREGAMQALYAQWGWVHHIWSHPLVIDNGREAIRQNPDGSIWRHEPDTKALWLMQGPVKERHVYPRLNSEEWDIVLSTQSWPGGQIPAGEIQDSFHVPGWH